MSPLNTMEDFRRDIAYRVLKREDGSILLTGTLQDRFHDIEMQVDVDAERMAITDIRAVFRRSPTSDCRNVSAQLQKLVGTVIGKGLNRRLMATLGGGEEGCGNLRSMLSGLLPLALNVRASAGITDEREMLDTIHRQLRGTCAGYAGPVPGDAS